jgi:hypothetical protein
MPVERRAEESNRIATERRALPSQAEAERAQRWMLGGSLALNLVLTVWLGYSARHDLSAVNFTLSTNAPAPKTTSLLRVNRAEPPSERVNPPPPFHWSDIESTSYAEYIARLRAVGCPEAVIRDIISADLSQLYSSRVRDIWGPPKREYWQKSRESDRPGPDQIHKLMQLASERQELEKTLLGSAVRQQDLMDLAFLQVQGPEQNMAWLSEERRAAAMAALEKSGYLAEEEKRMNTVQDGEGFEQMRQRQEKETEILKGVLTSDELKEYRMRTSPEASALRTELRYFDASQAEFDALVQLHDKIAKDNPVTPDFYAGKAAEVAAAKQIFGEERGREYERDSDLFYAWSRDAADRFGLPEETAAQAWTVKRDTLSAADQIRRDSTMADLEKKRRLAELQGQAETQLNDILGPKAARFARSGDGSWLQILPLRTQP